MRKLIRLREEKRLGIPILMGAALLGMIFPSLARWILLVLCVVGILSWVFQDK